MNTDKRIQALLAKRKQKERDLMMWELEREAAQRKLAEIREELEQQEIGPATEPGVLKEFLAQIETRIERLLDEVEEAL